MKIPRKKEKSEQPVIVSRINPEETQKKQKEVSNQEEIGERLITLCGRE